MKDFVTVFTAQKARQLLKEGFVITDIKPGKTDKISPLAGKSLYVIFNVHSFSLSNNPSSFLKIKILRL